MKAERARLALFIFLVIGVFAVSPLDGQSAATSTPAIQRAVSARDFLAQLSGFDVRVKLDHQDSSTIRKAIELKLRHNGIMADPEQPNFLIFECATLELEGFAGIQSFSCILSVGLAAVRRDPSLISGFVNAWYTFALGKVGADDLGDGLLGAANQLLDTFLSDWNAVNPKGR